MIAKPSAERVRSLLDYDESSGILRWRTRRSNMAAGSVAGTLDGRGYRIIRIDGAYQKAHRVVWLYVHGSWPELEIDHINGDRDDNRIANLRQATVSENQQNRAKAQSNSATGRIGVSFLSRERRWVAQLCVGGRRVLYKTFRSEDQATEAYIAAKQEFHPFSARITVNP